MSIKSFHILFITLSFMITIWFGLWSISDSLWLGLLSFFAAGCLVMYGIQVLKKFKTIT